MKAGKDIMLKYISGFILIFCILSMAYAQPDKIAIGDSIFVPMTSNFINVYGYPDSIRFARFYTDTVLTKFEEITWKKSDTLQFDYPIRKIYPGSFVWRGIGSFAGMAGDYLAAWFSFYTTGSNWGAKTYKVVPADTMPNEMVLSRVTEQLRQGTHWSPFGEAYGIEAFSKRGNHLVSLYVLDAEDSTAISKCDVKIVGADMKTTHGLWYTSSAGLAVFGLMDGDYKIAPFKAGYSFGNLPLELEVDGNALADTIWATAFDPGNPPLIGLCRVYGWVFGAGYDSLTGVTVQAKIKESPIRAGFVVISPYEKITATDSTGYWYLDLLPNEDLTPNDTKYQFSIYYSSGTVVRKEVIVPDQSSWEFSW